MRLGRTIKIKMLLSWGCLLLATLFAIGNASGDTARAVTLIYFRATGQDRAVLLEWATATQFNTAGFRLERARTKEGPYSRLDSIGFVPAVYEVFGGSEYSVIDRDGIINGQTYWYKLIEIEIDESEIPTDPIWAVAGIKSDVATVTATATIRVTKNPSTEPSSTPTASPTSTTSAQNPAAAGTPTPTTLFRSTAPARPGSRNSTATPDERPLVAALGESNNTSNANAFAQLETATLPAGYPIQPATATPPFPDQDSSGAFYPAPTGTLPFAQATVFLPEFSGSGTGFDQGNGNPPPISGQQNENLGNSAGRQNVNQGTSTIFLWLGFLAALIIFLTGVYASIIYFTRRRSKEQ